MSGLPRGLRLRCIALGSMLFLASCDLAEEITPDASRGGGGSSSGASSSSSSGASSSSSSGASSSSSSGASSSSGSSSGSSGSGSSSGGSRDGGGSSSGSSGSGSSSGGSRDAGGSSSGSSGSGSSGGGSRDAGGSSSGSSGGGSSSGGSSDAGSSGDGSSGRPCDIYAAGGTPCVAAHSTLRALYGSYNGNLYQVRRSSDSTKKDIGVLAPGGFADTATQDSFCSGTSCVITIVYDQSDKGNHLEYQGQGSSVGGKDQPSVATTESLTVSGHKVYSLYIKPGNSYWRNGSKSGIPTGSAPEGMYMVTSGTHVNGGCCFDYGNSETTRKADGAGAMDAIYFGTSCWFGGCSGSGPWVQADLEYGLFPGGSKTWNMSQRAFNDKYVTAMLKNNGTTKLALKGGNAQSGGLTTLWDGALPSGYNPMKKQGAIILGSGGDCCATNTNLSQGTFYEGAIVSGYPSDATENSIQNDIIAARYGG